MLRPSHRRLVRLLTVAWIGGALLVGCGDDGPAPTPDEMENPQPDCTKITPPTYEQLLQGTLSHCVVCHSSTLTGDARNGAPDGVNFDSYDAAKLVVQQAYGMVKGHYMPYPDGKGITNAERNRFYEWALCGTPP
jgi:uncharacterized membrane protein